MILDLHDQVTISPALPLRRVATYNASALPLELINIPDAFGDAELTGVGVSIVNADGLEISAPCVRRGDQWRVAFAASCVPTYGFVERGVKVTVSVREDSVERDIVLGVGDLEVMRSAPSAEPGDPSKGYVTKGSDRFDKSKVVDGVQHFVKQTMEYDEEMHAWGATWTGDYILEDGEFIPYEAPTGGGVTTAAVALLMLLAPFVTSAITATKEYVDRKDGEIAQASTNYTDSAIAEIPAPDFSTSNAVLVATIEATAPVPGNYAAVSNAAMNAVQSQSMTNYATRAEIEDGWWSAWKFSGTEPPTGYYYDVGYDTEENPHEWTLFIVNISDPTIRLQYDTGEGDEDAEMVEFTMENVTATRRHIAGQTPTKTSELANDGDGESPFVTSNALETATSAVSAAVPTIVTNIVQDLSLGGIWDAELEVWWTPRMRNGSLTYEATTNVNLNAVN